MLELLNSGVLVRFEGLGAQLDSDALVDLKLLNSERFSAHNLGPLRMLCPEVPIATPVGWVRLAVLNH